MAGDVAHKIKATAVGKEGAVYIAPNGLKIVPTPPDSLESAGSINAISDLALSGQYDTRFDDTSYYSA